MCIPGHRGPMGYPNNIYRRVKAWFGQSDAIAGPKERSALVFILPKGGMRYWGAICRGCSAMVRITHHPEAGRLLFLGLAPSRTGANIASMARFLGRARASRTLCPRHNIACKLNA